MTLPITPEQALERQIKAIPDFVIEAFNELLVETFSGRTARILQDTVMDRILEKAAVLEGHKDLTRHDVFDRKWLNIESKYEESGWKVSYFKPSYGETGDPAFTFSHG